MINSHQILKFLKIIVFLKLLKIIIFFVLVPEVFEKQIEADKLQGYDYVGYHSYAKRRYNELVGGKKYISVFTYDLCLILLKNCVSLIHHFSFSYFILFFRLCFCFNLGFIFVCSSLISFNLI